MVPQYAVMQPANQLTFLHDEWLMAGLIRVPFRQSIGLHWWLSRPCKNPESAPVSLPCTQLYAFQYIYPNLSVHLRASAGLLLSQILFKKARMIVFSPHEQTIVMLFIKVNHDISSW